MKQGESEIKPKYKDSSLFFGAVIGATHRTVPYVLYVRVLGQCDPHYVQ